MNSGVEPRCGESAGAFLSSSRLLPALQPVEKFAANKEVELDEADQRRRVRASGEDAMDEDDEQPGMQCANQ
ncbi:hypothetical protein VTO73DRAFT_7990 [Trametes versicolor]